MDKRFLAGAVLVSSCCFLTARAVQPAPIRQKTVSPSSPKDSILRTQPDFGKMAVDFIPNRGQLDERIAFYIQGTDKTIFFNSEGLTFVLTKAGEKRRGTGQENRTPDDRMRPDPEASPGFPPDSGAAADMRWVVKLDFLSARPAVKPAGMDKTGTLISCFSGPAENWKSGLPTYSRIIYSDLWPGIDLVYSGTTGRLKSEFIVHPGADPSRIRLVYRGADSVVMNAEGGLVVSTPGGGFEEGKPIAYQEQNGTRVNVPLAYDILDDGHDRLDREAPGQKTGPRVVYGFSVGDYDRTGLLVLDPVMLMNCGYIGGPSFDYCYGIAADASGNTYVTGYTYSTGASFPVAVGPDRTFNGGGVDAFVAKINASGTALDYCGYIGGTGSDYGYGIAVDLTGHAYITGYTSSPAASFPVSIGPDLTPNGSYDVFVAKVNPEGTALDYCGYIGGSNLDYGRGIAVDLTGHAYVSGYTASTGASFPVSIGPDSTQKGLFDAFVAKVNPSGTALDYCGFIGGTGEDYGYGIAVDLSGHAYVTGYTASMEGSFPVVTGPDLYFAGDFDAFVAKVNAEGTGLDYCGYIGGAARDSGYGIAVDHSGCAYVTGYTNSTETTFPVVSGPGLTQKGVYDGFVAKVNAEGTALDYCGYIGGSIYDIGTSIAVDGWGYAYVTGYTSSKEDSFPVKEGPDLTTHGSFDAFLAKVDASGTELSFCGYIGGAAADYGTSIALGADGSGNIYLAGTTYSTESTFPVGGGPDLSYNGSRDGFVAKIYENSITLTAPNGGENWHVGFYQDITWLTAGSVGKVKIEFSTDNGDTWMEIAGETDNDGSYRWLVPDAVSAQCLVRMSEAADGDPSDKSQAVFTINNDPLIIVTSPNGGENWVVGSTHDITWLSGGEVGDVKIEYSTDDQATWTVIVEATGNDGSYAWTVPDAVSTTCWVRVSEAEDAFPGDTSDAAFTISAATTPAAIRSRAPRPAGRWPRLRLIQGGPK